MPSRATRSTIGGAALADAGDFLPLIVVYSEADSADPGEMTRYPTERITMTPSLRAFGHIEAMDAGSSEGRSRGASVALITVDTH